MNASSPTIAGFRAAFRRPSLTFAEISWRWTLGATATAVFIFSLVEYLNTLPVTKAELALLSTRRPALIGRALNHIFRGSLNRTVFTAFVAVLALSTLWVLAASIGRLASVKALIDYFRKDMSSELSTTAGEVSIDGSNIVQGPSDAPTIRALIGLNALRVAVVVAAALALTGAAILAGFASSAAHPRPGLALLLFFPLAAIVLSAGWSLNWWLSLAQMFAVREGESALGAISTSVTFFRERIASVIAVGTWTGLAHLVAFSVATTLVSFSFAFIQIAPSRLVIFGIILETLAYFAVVDWLYMVRLAGYVFIADMPNPSLAAPVSPPRSPVGKAPLIESSIDRNETILSDIPNVILET